jgi:hypothetical protein
VTVLMSEDCREWHNINDRDEDNGESNSLFGGGEEATRREERRVGVGVGVDGEGFGWGEESSE